MGRKPEDFRLPRHSGVNGKKPEGRQETDRVSPKALAAAQGVLRGTE